MPKRKGYKLSLSGMGVDEVVEQPTVGTLTAGPADITRGEQRRAAPSGRFVIGDFNIQDPESIDDPELRELAIQYRDAQTAGLDTSEIRRQLAARVSTVLNERARAELLNPTDLALWSALGAVAGFGLAKVMGADTKKYAIGGGVVGAAGRVVKGLPAYAGAKLASAVIGGAANAQTTAEVQAADQAAAGVGRWR